MEHPHLGRQVPAVRPDRVDAAEFVVVLGQDADQPLAEQRPGDTDGVTGKEVDGGSGRVHECLRIRITLESRALKHTDPHLRGAQVRLAVHKFHM